MKRPFIIGIIALIVIIVVFFLAWLLWPMIDNSVTSCWNCITYEDGLDKCGECNK